jgi:hypothetical protein
MEGGGVGSCIEEMKGWLDRRGGGEVSRCIEEIKWWLDERGGNGYMYI